MKPHKESAQGLGAFRSSAASLSSAASQESIGRASANTQDLLSEAHEALPDWTNRSFCQSQAPPLPLCLSSAPTTLSTLTTP